MKRAPLNATPAMPLWVWRTPSYAEWRSGSIFMHGGPGIEWSAHDGITRLLFAESALAAMLEQNRQQGIAS